MGNGHANVANFYSISIEVSVELGSLGKVPVQRGQELLCNVDANLFVPLRIKPGHISLPGSLLSCRFLGVLELVVVPCLLQCMLICWGLYIENISVGRFAYKSSEAALFSHSVGGLSSCAHRWGCWLLS